MFYDENVAMNQVEEEPSLVFELIKEQHFELVDKILSKKIISLNTYDKDGNSILTILLKNGCYDIVSKYISDKDFDINHQNNDGDTFAHVMATINYVNIIDIINKLRKNKNFIPNIKNNNGQTILDKSINNKYMYTTIKILEDSRFNNIDILSFKNLYETYINNKNYGKYTKIANLEVILDNLDKKSLLPRMKNLVTNIKNNIDTIKEEIISNNYKSINEMINTCLVESM